MLLFGGGMSLVTAFEDFKLTKWFGKVLNKLDVLSYALISSVLTMTEVISNIATSNILITITMR